MRQVKELLIFHKKLVVFFNWEFTGDIKKMSILLSLSVNPRINYDFPGFSIKKFSYDPDARLSEENTRRSVPVM